MEVTMYKVFIVTPASRDCTRRDSTSDLFFSMNFAHDSSVRVAMEEMR